MKKIYNNEVLSNLNRQSGFSSEFLTESDIQHLPFIVQKYLGMLGLLEKRRYLILELSLRELFAQTQVMIG